MRRRNFIHLLGSAVAAWPRALRAQQALVPVIGFLNSASASGFAPRVAAFRQGLEEAGYVEGRNVAIEFRWAEGHYDRLPRLAAELVSRNVAVIVATGGTASAQAAKHATPSIPIVFTVGGDPIALGLVSNLSRPGGNVTGAVLLTAELVAKRFEVLRELVPLARIIGMFVNPDNPLSERNIRTVQGEASAQGVTIHVGRARLEPDFAPAFAALAKAGAQALLVDADPYFEDRRSILVALAARYSLPAIYDWRVHVDAGGLVSYGANYSAAYRQAGVYAGRILGGASPSDLPVVQLKSIELVINLKTAKALTLAIPQSILARADEVIE